MAELSEAQKIFIVRRRANCVEIHDIQAQFEEQFGEKIKSAQISAYDATTVHGRERMGKDLQALFHEERRAYLADDDVPMANPNFWVKELNKMYFAPGPGNQPKSDKAKMALMDMAMKLKGGMYQQKQNGPTPAEVDDYVAGQVEKAVKTVLTAAEEAVRETVTNPQEQGDAVKAIKGRLASKVRPDSQ